MRSNYLSARGPKSMNVVTFSPNRVYGHTRRPTRSAQTTERFATSNLRVDTS